MKKTFLHRLLLSLIACSLFTSAFFTVYADPREGFAIFWKDNSKKDVALKCLQECISDRYRVLNITKHLIGGGHVFDISETIGKLPADFLFVYSSGEIVNFLKFLRGLYNIDNDGTNGHPKGALFILKSTSDLSHKVSALLELQKIFNYGVNCTFTAEHSTLPLTRVEALIECIGDASVIERKTNAIKYAMTLCRQLEAGNKGAINNLEKRLSKEIAVYRECGFDVSLLTSITDTPEKILQLKTDLRPLIDALTPIASTVALPDISHSIEEIKAITDAFFNTRKELLNEKINEFFVGVIGNYLNFFSTLLDISIKCGIDEISKKKIKISFEKSFTNVDFRDFVLQVLKISTPIEPPDKTVNVTLALKSELQILPVSQFKVAVSSLEYDVITTYLATFFPYS
jgi:hypothetical protein